MGDDWIYSRYETTAALRDSYDNREISVAQFWAIFPMVVVKNTCKSAYEKLVTLRKMKKREPTALEKRLSGL